MPSPSRADRALRFALRAVKLASWLVPAHRRTEWLREWRAELWTRGAAGGRVVEPALGAFSHGVWLRTDDAVLRLNHLVRDLRFGMRALRRRPLFACSGVLTLALGLGATTAVYSVVDAVLLAPLPYPGADRFVRVQAEQVEYDMTMALSAELFTEWKRRARGFDAFEAYVSRNSHLAGAGTPAIVREARISAGFLSELLAVRPVVGRLLDPHEATGSGPPVALISERLWVERFGGSRDVIGRVIRIDDRETHIVGVVPRLDLLPAVDLWTAHPLAVDHSRVVLGALQVIARVEAGVTPAEAQARLEAAHAQAAADYATSMNPFAPVVSDYRAGLVADLRTHLLLLLGAVAIVLVIACLNVANLFLGRGVERSHELAVRTSLGASRGHLISQVVAESLVLALAGGAAGVVLAAISVDAILAVLPAEIPLGSAIALNGRVLGFAAAATLGTAVLVGVAPTLRAGTAAAPVSHARGMSLTRRQRRTGAVLLGVEVAQASALLVAAGLMVNTLVRMSTASSGFDPNGLLFVHLDLPRYSFATADNPTRRSAFMVALRSGLQAIPGVRSVGIGSATPFSGITFMTGIEPEGGIHPEAGDGGLIVRDDGERTQVYFSRLHVDPVYLQTLGLPLVAGRGFVAGDMEAAAGVALINETAAAAYWPGQSPVGRRVRETGGEWVTIVGVVGDFGHPGLPTRGVAEIYLPMSRAVLPTISRPTALIRHDGPADAIIDRVQRAVWALDPDLPIPAVASAQTELGARLAMPRFYASLLGTFAGLALALAAVGIYGVVAHTVARRTREIGVRIALGAPAAQVGRMVMREGMQVVAIGLAAGLAGGAAASRLLAGLLYGVAATDPWTYAAVGALLALVAAVAVWIPARRAMKADPVASLRSD